MLHKPTLTREQTVTVDDIEFKIFASFYFVHGQKVYFKVDSELTEVIGKIGLFGDSCWGRESYEELEFCSKLEALAFAKLLPSLFKMADEIFEETKGLREQMEQRDHERASD